MTDPVFETLDELAAWAKQRDDFCDQSGEAVRRILDAHPHLKPPRRETMARNYPDLLTKAVGDITAALIMAGHEKLIQKWTEPYIKAIEHYDDCGDELEQAAKALYEADDVWHAAFPWPNLAERNRADEYRRLVASVIPMFKIHGNTEGAGHD